MRGTRVLLPTPRNTRSHHSVLLQRSGIGMAPFFSALATFLRTALGMPPQQQLVPGVSRGSLAPTSPQPLHPLKSGPSTSPTHVLFRNTTDVAVKCFWIDYDGKEVPYEVIGPGKTYLQRTFVQHPWLFRDVSSGCPMVVCRKVVVLPEDKPASEMLIEKPKLLPWCPTAHSRFPLDFKRTVRNLLVWHHSSITLHAQEASEERAESAMDHDRVASLQEHLKALPLELLICILAHTAPEVLDILP